MTTDRVKQLREIIHRLQFDSHMPLAATDLYAIVRGLEALLAERDRWKQRIVDDLSHIARLLEERDQLKTHVEKLEAEALKLHSALLSTGFWS